MSPSPPRRNDRTPLPNDGAGSTAWARLPIYRAALDTVVALDVATARFARRHRYGIGEQLRQTSLRLLLLIPQANRRIGRAEALAALCMASEELKLLLNVGKELAAFHSFAEFARLSDQVVNLARQAEGWRRHSEGLDRPEHGGGSSGEPRAPRRSV